MVQTLSLDQRLSLLHRVPAFSLFEETSLRPLAETSQEVACAPHHVLIRENDPGDCAYLIIEGMAEVTAAGPKGPVLVATLSKGELFGELALLSATGKRSGTVTAMTAMRLLVISGGVFKHLIETDPRVKSSLEETAELLFKIRFLKLCASPFSVLPPELFQRLASKLKQVTWPHHAVVVQQGEEGNYCFIIRQGQAEVILESPEEGPRSVATLGPGSLFGETSLLTQGPRTMTVKTISACELLVLERHDLMEVLGQTPALDRQLKDLIQKRARPQKVSGIVAIKNMSTSGEPFTILKNSSLNTYYRLSPQAQYLWDRLDGQPTLQELTQDCTQMFKTLTAESVQEIVSSLNKAGFLRYK